MTKLTYKQLRRGDELVNPDFPHAPHRFVADVLPARARGYLVVTFVDGTRTSGHESTECYLQSATPR